IAEPSVTATAQPFTISKHRKRKCSARSIKTRRVIAGGGCPLGVLIHFIRSKRPGRPKESEVLPDPKLRYWQVVKERKGRRLFGVTRRVIFGVEELIPLKQISTSLLERLNGTIRQHVVPLHRKTRSFAKCRKSLDTQTQLFKSYYNLCRKH